MTSSVIGSAKQIVQPPSSFLTYSLELSSSAAAKRHPPAAMSESLESMNFGFAGPSSLGRSLDISLPRPLAIPEHNTADTRACSSITGYQISGFTSRARESEREREARAYLSKQFLKDRLKLRQRLEMLLFSSELRSPFLSMSHKE